MKSKKLLSATTIFTALAIIFSICFAAPAIRALDSAENEDSVLTVNYYGNGGLTEDSQALLSVEDNTVVYNSFSKTSSKFAAWNTSADGSGIDYQPGDTIEADAESVDLYARWEDDYHYVYYNGNGGKTEAGEEVITDNQYKKGDTVAFLDNPFIREGYTFLEWNTSADGTGTSGPLGRKFLMVGSDITFYAIWVEGTQESDTESETETDSSDSEEDSSTDTLVDTESDTATDTATDSATDTETATDSTTDTDTATDTTTDTSSDTQTDTEATKPQLYSFKYVTSESEEVDGTYAKGTELIIKDYMGTVKTGYVFDHWSTSKDDNGTKYMPGDKFTMPEGEVSLYAIFVPGEYTLTYVANTGSTEEEEKVAGPFVYGSVVTAEKNTFAKEGYVFAGWNTMADGKGTSIKPGDKFYMASRDVKLYAQWKVPSYSSSYNGTIKTGVDNTVLYASIGALAIALAVTVLCVVLKKRKSEI